MLALAAARGQDAHPRRGRERPRLADEAGLPDAGVALDRHEAAVASARDLDHRAQRRELRFALEEDEAAGSDPRARAGRELRKHVAQPGDDELVEPLRHGRDHRACSRRGRGARPRAGGRARRASRSSRRGGSGRRDRRRRSVRPGGPRSRRTRPRRASPRPCGRPCGSGRRRAPATPGARAPLAGDRGLDGRARAPEDGEEGVALPVDLDAARVLEGAAGAARCGSRGRGRSRPARGPSGARSSPGCPRTGR